MSTVDSQQTTKVDAHTVTSSTGTKVRTTLSSRLSSVLVVVLTLLWTIPTFGLFVTSFRPDTEVASSGWWTVFTNPVFTLDNYNTVLFSGGYNVQGGLIPYFVNSLVVSIPGSLFPLALATMAAYALAWIPFKGSNTIFFIVFGLQVVPLQLALVPLLRLFNTGVHIGDVTVFPALGITGHFASLWVTHTMFAMPLAIFLLHNFMAQLPRDLMEAARVDGANSFLIFRKIVLPLSAPSIASFAIFQFLWVWNDLLVSLTFVGASKEFVSPLTTRLQALVGNFGSHWELLAPSAFVAIVVPLIVFFALQKYFVRGLLAGSVKG
ncbi:carbohydrate ABC transporter permease [Actinotalea sp. M2MS4P-6]|uniref:carbohydrate ABC transporter permease n=1 Tax=Actinotalea sp. M2MS4P-6 TaxID=2983762 RepID=UPI0021E3E79A|nr:carbohydrate ABC transporter permease [Actinotalea sp. M2MS4P-6]MCV2395295.1 carbohydrate ABC transporter permease [Actinotalea sp. M2MS4P-6]